MFEWRPDISKDLNYWLIIKYVPCLFVIHVHVHQYLQVDAIVHTKVKSVFRYIYHYYHYPYCYYYYYYYYCYYYFHFSTRTKIMLLQCISFFSELVYSETLSGFVFVISGVRLFP